MNKGERRKRQDRNQRCEEAGRNMEGEEMREERGRKKEERGDHIKTTYQPWTDPFTVPG